MDRLETVLGRRGPHFVRILVSQFGFSEAHAERLVSLAGTDLIESYRSRATEIHSALSAPESVRELLGTMRGNQIAESLGIPASEVWCGLRVFVPSVLELADGRHAHEA